MIYYLPILNYSLHRVREMVMVKRNSDFLKHCHTSKLSLLLIFVVVVSWVSESEFQKHENFFKAIPQQPI